MTKAIEVIYEDNVFKPLVPVEGLKEHERMIVIFSQASRQKGLRDLAGTITHDEARTMQDLIDTEFEKIPRELVV